MFSEFVLYINVSILYRLRNEINIEAIMNCVHPTLERLRGISGFLPISNANSYAISYNVEWLTKQY